MKFSFRQLLPFAALCFSMACSKPIKSNEYQLTAQIEGLSDEMGYLVTMDPEAPRGFRIDSVPIAKGCFSFSHPVTEPEVMRMSFRSNQIMKWIGEGKQRGMIPSKAALLHFIAYPGGDIQVKGQATDYINAYPEGDTENEILGKLNAQVYPIINESVNLARTTMDLKTPLSEEAKKVITQKQEELGKRLEAIQLKFLDEHISSIAGLWLAEDMLIRSQIEIEQVDQLMKKVDHQKYATLSYYKSVSDRVQGYKASAVGQISPTVSGTDLTTDQHFSIESLRGKYVILDFWGTWCGPCVKGMPHMKAFRDQHASKIQIVGLVKDNSIESIKKVFADVQVDWPNIQVGKDDQDYVAKFNVQGYPTKLLLDPQGKILLRSVGESEEFYQQVEEIIL